MHLMKKVKVNGPDADEVFLYLKAEAPCQIKWNFGAYFVVDGAGTQACALTWAEGCGDAPPPDGRTADATVAELCAESCTFFAVQGELELGEGNHM